MFIPSPVDVDPEALQAQTNPIIPHHSPKFDAFLKKM
jgi:aspartate aminotransferase-like enzyme